MFRHSLWAWEAFDLLSRQRSVGPNGPIPITPTDMYSYCRMAGLYKARHLDFLLRVIPLLDGVYLKNFYEEQEKRLEKDRRKSASQSKKAPRR